MTPTQLAILIDAPVSEMERVRRELGPGEWQGYCAEWLRKRGGPRWRETVWTDRMERRARGSLRRGEARRLAKDLIARGSFWAGGGDMLLCSQPLAVEWSFWHSDDVAPHVRAAAVEQMRSWARDKYWWYGPLP